MRTTLALGSILLLAPYSLADAKAGAVKVVLLQKPVWQRPLVADINDWSNEQERGLGHERSPCLESA